METIGHTIRGNVFLEKKSFDAYRKPQETRPWIEVINVQSGIVVGRFQYKGAYHYCVKWDDGSCDDWYEVPKGFSGIPRDKLA